MPARHPLADGDPLPVELAWPADSVWPLLAPSAVLQLVPCEAATPLLLLAVAALESVWLTLSVCEPESVCDQLSVCAPDVVLASLVVCPQPLLVVTPCAVPVVSVTVLLSVWLTP